MEVLSGRKIRMSKHPNTEKGTGVWLSFPSAAILMLLLLLQRFLSLSLSPSYSAILRSGRGSLEEEGIGAKTRRHWSGSAIKRLWLANSPDVISAETCVPLQPDGPGQH